MRTIGSAAERVRDGCTGFAADVGVLLPFRVTFTNGVTHTVRYCDTCAEIAAYGVENPGAPVGAGAAPIHMVKIERVAERPALTADASSLPAHMSDDEIVREYEDGYARVIDEAHPDASRLAFPTTGGTRR